MNYEFNFGSLVLGALILVAGILFVRYHQWLAQNFGAGVGSYDRYKLYGLITCGLGLLVATNLHVVILRWALSFVFPGLK